MTAATLSPPVTPSVWRRLSDDATLPGMATVLLIGPDAPLLEGLAQTLGAVGHRTHIATSVGDALNGAAADRPLIAVIERDLIAGDSEALHIPLAPGGALVTYRTRSEEPRPLPTPVQRAVLADLALPLERHRLVALVHSVAGRAQVTGRGPVHTPAGRQVPYHDEQGGDSGGGEGLQTRAH
ncbi:MAG: hypothetical protein NVS4B3_08780 [Gemmatimonadaceae bacterium]